MQIIQPSYDIWQLPEGEACLTFLERVARTAYKSEGNIDSGREPCRSCWMNSLNPLCSRCGGKGWVQVREPSSHKLLRKILKVERRDQLAGQARELLKPLTGERVEAVDIRLLSRRLVDLVADSYMNDPAHTPVLDHAFATVLFTTNRGITHEIVRHRVGVAYMQESTRYCNYNKDKFGSEITITERFSPDIDSCFEPWHQALLSTESGYLQLVNSGVAPQLARDVLPQVLKADIVVTATFTAWRHFFRMRCSPKAHPDVRGLMIPLRDEFRARTPIVFDELL